MNPDAMKDEAYKETARLIQDTTLSNAAIWHYLKFHWKKALVYHTGERQAALKGYKKALRDYDRLED